MSITTESYPCRSYLELFESNLIHWFLMAPMMNIGLLQSGMWEELGTLTVGVGNW
nr:hypothetical protein [Providencia rettgeri]